MVIFTNKNSYVLIKNEHVFASNVNMCYNMNIRVTHNLFGS